MKLKNLEVRLEIPDQAIRQEFAAIISSVEGFDIYGPREAGIADLLIMQLGDHQEEEIQKAHQALSSGSARNVFLTSLVIKPEIVIQAMRIGVKEFFPQPLKTEDLKLALVKIAEESQKDIESESAQKTGMIINVIGSKGGVGTTTVAANLATSLAILDPEKSVALVDMNLLFGEIRIFLGIDSIFDWVEVAKNIYRLDSTYLLGVMSLHRSGVRVLPSPTTATDEFLVTPKVVETLLVQLKSMFDYIVIDSGQSLDEISKTTIRLCDNLIIVTLLSLPCMVNVKRLQDALWKFGYPQGENIKILVNRYQKSSIISVEDVQKSLKKKIFWSIPNDFNATMTAINQGKPLAAVVPGAEIAVSFKKLAFLIAG